MAFDPWDMPLFIERLRLHAVAARVAPEIPRHIKIKYSISAPCSSSSSDPWYIQVRCNVLSTNTAIQPVDGTFSLGNMKGCIKFASADDDESLLGNPPERSAQIGPVTHTFEEGQLVHFRWRGSHMARSANEYASEPLSPRTTVVASSSPPNAATEASVLRDQSWAGHGEMLWFDNDRMEVTVWNQGEKRELDGVRIVEDASREDGTRVDGEVLSDDYGRTWYELFWLSERCGDWSGDEEADLLDTTGDGVGIIF